MQSLLYSFVVLHKALYWQCKYHLCPQGIDTNKTNDLPFSDGRQPDHKVADGQHQMPRPIPKPAYDHKVIYFSKSPRDSSTRAVVSSYPIAPNM